MKSVFGVLSNHHTTPVPIPLLSPSISQFITIAGNSQEPQASVFFCSPNNISPQPNEGLLPLFQSEEDEQEQGSFIVVNFYRFVFIKGLDIHGRIYVNEQGINAQLTASDPLASVDKEKTDILMYCTGGIRYDIYSSILRQGGFRNLFTLKGGVSHYLQKEGLVEWVGNLFVFDSCLSLPPSSYNPGAVTEGDKSRLASEDSTFARCFICQSRLSELKHQNCANLDCNRLFL